jgi:ATP-dependent DNA helicase PIF1
MTQDQALAILKSGASAFLTGEPGSGKTHTINRYVAHLHARGIEPARTASTGIAATHVSGMTIHSWSGIGIKNFLTPFDLDRIASNERVVKRILKARVLIIDEVSMLEAKTLEMVDQVCREVRRNHHPFGGLQTVLVGDFFQLPPVSHEGRVADFCFRSPTWAKLHPVVCYLSEQHRQDDKKFLSLLSAIRANAVTDEHTEVLLRRTRHASTAPADAVKLFPHNVDVDRINDGELAKLPGDAHSFLMRAHGPDHMIDSLKRGCLSPEMLRLKIGAAVMFTRNHPQGQFVNGTLGAVTGFVPGTGTPIVKTRAGIELTAEPMEWKIDDQGKALASVEQVPLRLAWAMTVHKSQGMSLDAAVMDLGNAFEYGQGYVALSRVRRLSGLFLRGCNGRALEVHPDVLAQDEVFRNQSLDTEAEIVDRSPDDQREIENAFMDAIGGRISSKSEAHNARSEAPSGTSSFEKVREAHPKAYAKWNAEEEALLTALFKEGVHPKKIAERLQRKPGGIVSRLKKLGLVEEHATEP